jgi:3-(methylthio)propanoyl-CoA dehydrogenase
MPALAGASLTLRGAGKSKMEFKYDLRDLKFIIKERLPTEDVLACDRFKRHFGMEDVEILLNEAYKVAHEIISPVSGEGDMIGAHLDDAKVKPAPGFKEAFRFLQQNGWGSSS